MPIRKCPSRIPVERLRGELAESEGREEESAGKTLTKSMLLDV